MSAVRWLSVAVLGTAVLTASLPVALRAQERGSVAGTVRDDVDGAPLEGATIKVVNTDLEATADDQGGFILDDVPVGDITVRVAQPGYSAYVDQIHVEPGDVSYLPVRLPRVEALLRRLLVQQNRRRGAVGGSEADVKGTDKADYKSAADLLSDDVPGVDVRWGSGSVGSGATIVIRGVGSISQSNTPAVYVDGIRVDAEGRQSPAAQGTIVLGVLESIPASEVERIRVLRGPSAAAIYGDSSNGVILVETRRGSSSGGDSEDQKKPEDDGGSGGGN